MKWENYLKANTLAGDIDTSLKRHSNSINSSISNASQEIIDSNIASQKEITRVLQNSFDDIVDGIDKVGESVESLRADFDFAIGEVLWKLELVQGTLTDILKEVRLAEFEREARSLRERAEDAYKNGWYKESLSDFLEAEKLNYQDFAVLFSIANIYLYHSTEYEDDYKEPSLEKALAYYLKSAKYSAPKSKKHAAKFYLFSGWSCYLLEKDEEALDYTSKAIELNPKLAEACFQKAKILMCLNAPDKALAPLRKAIESDRDYSIKATTDPDFKNYDTEVQRLLDEMRTEAQKVAQEALAYAEDQIKNITKIDMGGKHNFQNSYRDEIKYVTCEMAKATHSFHSDTLYGYLDTIPFRNKALDCLFQALMRFKEEFVADIEEQIEDARERLIDLNRKISDNPPGVFGKSRELKRLESEEEDANKNRQYLQGRLLKLEKSLDANAYLAIGNAYGSSDMWKKAIESYKQAIRIKPDGAKIHFNLGVAYHSSKMCKEAIESYKQAIKIDPDYVDAHFNLGVAYLDLDDKGSALEQHKILKTLDTEKANILLNYINE